MKYKYDTHVHTCEASACALLGGAEYIALYKKLGYDGIIITDHFFNGNTAVPREIPWKERIEQFCSGYEKAKIEGDKQGLAVFFGIETRFDGDEYLVYGVDKEWLLFHPDMLDWSRREQFERISAEGGLVVHAHPFRERPYIKDICLCTGYVHAVEVANAGNKPEFDGRAYYYAKNFSLPMTAGTDMHFEAMADRGMMGMGFDTPLTSIADYISRVKAGEYELIVPEGRLPEKPDKGIGLPVRLLDDDGNETPVSFDDIFGGGN